ncbi:PadR family transcriptional regulator [Cryptosporangium aurantiacum]|uniref:Transcriptional regulator PadR-like family protein n=1 Tax=Cryptosporangium aurantiacum TaxID=134849 RepID=A0A1M7RLG0_9ACTN|nr:PadR family transcriptional regulator [Cryptosporangium aurantiacum]SHN47019.1 Transcriptional regulator PadR-like family protein [Cryptosporangium aurantiacum]
MISSPPPRLTTTSYALLGLLAVQPWTAYELTQQMRRSLHYVWPKSESVLYTEPKKLVEAGLAEVSHQRRGDRTRAQYHITAAGRRALQEWLDTEPATPLFELEVMLRLIFADQGTPEQLLRSLRSTGAWADAEMAASRSQIENYLETGGPFPERLHLIALLVGFYGELFGLIRRFADQTAELVEGWDATTSDVPIDANLRNLLERALRSIDTPQ